MFAGGAGETELGNEEGTLIAGSRALVRGGAGGAMPPPTF